MATPADVNYYIDTSYTVGDLETDTTTLRPSVGKIGKLYYVRLITGSERINNTANIKLVGETGSRTLVTNTGISARAEWGDITSESTSRGSIPIDNDNYIQLEFITVSGGGSSDFTLEYLWVEVPGA